MLRSCLLLMGLPLLAVLGLLFFVGNEQTGDAVPFPQTIPIVPSPYYVPTSTPIAPQGDLHPAQQTATFIIRSATETVQALYGTPTYTPTFGSPTALPNFEGVSSPFPNPT